jgi:hypothetical protein
MATRDQLRHWGTLTYHDPARILRDLRVLEHEIASIKDDKVRRLRTPTLKKYREWRDAALFTYGMSVAHERPMGYATEESSDYDFVVAWIQDNQQYFCPVQLKELVPADLNPRATLQDLLGNLPNYSPGTDTVLAVRLNRRGKMDLKALTMPTIPFKQLWFFWAASPDGNRWTIYGDALKEPGQATFDYPK